MNTPVPVARRSVAGQALGGLPVDGLLRLQRCTACNTVQYPPRERCAACLDDALRVEAVPAGATVLAATALHHSLDPWFSRHLPWHVASLALDAGPVALAHVTPGLASAGTRVRVATALDAGAGWCLVAFADDGRDPIAALGDTLQTLGFDT